MTRSAVTDPAAIDIAALIPHAGAMCLLDKVVRWSDAEILCSATSHLAPANPLRRDGRLNPVCGAEYALQAAALHGALRGGAPQPPGFLAGLRLAFVWPGRLDDPALGPLRVAAHCEHGDAAGLIYRLTLHGADGTALLEGRATVMLTRPGQYCG